MFQDVSNQNKGYSKQNKNSEEFCGETSGRTTRLAISESQSAGYVADASDPLSYCKHLLHWMTRRYAALPGVGRWRSIPDLYPIYTPSIPHLYPIYTPSIPELYPIYTPSIPDLYPIYTRSIPHLYPIYTRSIPHLYPIYTRSIPDLYPIYTRSIPDLYPIYTRSIPDLYPIYTRSHEVNNTPTLPPRGRRGGDFLCCVL